MAAAPRSITTPAVADVMVTMLPAEVPAVIPPEMVKASAAMEIPAPAGCVPAAVESMDLVAFTVTDLAVPPVMLITPPLD